MARVSPRTCKRDIARTALRQADFSCNGKVKGMVSSYQQHNFIEVGGWHNVAALDEQVSGAADLCAPPDQLVAMEDLPPSTVGSDPSTNVMPASDG